MIQFFEYVAGDLKMFAQIHLLFRLLRVDSNGRLAMLNPRIQPAQRGIRMKFGVILFPGSNCDHDAFWTIQQVAEAAGGHFCGNDRTTPKTATRSSSPGGFASAITCAPALIAKFSPVMESVRKFADGGGSVLGICNGFQILCESWSGRW